MWLSSLTSKNCIILTVLCGHSELHSIVLEEEVEFKLMPWHFFIMLFCFLGSPHRNIWQWSPSICSSTTRPFLPHSSWLPSHIDLVWLSPHILWPPSLPFPTLWHPAHCHTCQSLSAVGVSSPLIFFSSQTSKRATPALLIKSSLVMRSLSWSSTWMWGTISGRYLTCWWCWLSSVFRGGQWHEEAQLCGCSDGFGQPNISKMLENSCSFANSDPHIFLHFSGIWDSKICEVLNVFYALFIYYYSFYFIQASGGRFWSFPTAVALVFSWRMRRPAFSPCPHKFLLISWNAPFTWLKKSQIVCNFQPTPLPT